jgi:uronate dehydrogenase
MQRVLVTGSAGAVGRPVVEELVRRGHAVRGFDLVPTPGLADTVVGDVADSIAVERATEGVTAVVHLGAFPNPAPIETLVAPNLLGVHYVLEAARKHAVRRVVLASTIQVFGPPEEWRLATSDDRQPGNLYALTKLWAEEHGAMYARLHGMSIVAARIGWMVRDEREAAHMRERGMFHAYLSRGDVACFVAMAIEAERLPFAVMAVVGPEGASRFDLEPARRLLGWEPRDVFPAGLPFPFER